MAEENYIYRSTKPTNDGHSNVSISQFMAFQLAKYDADLIALIDPTSDTSLTYGQLHLKSQYFASALVELGVTSNDLVVFCAENNFDYVIALIGSIYLGLTFCPVPPACGPFEISEQIKGSNGTVLVVGGDKIKTIEKALNEPSYVDTMRQLRVVVQLDCQQPDTVLVDHSAFMDTKVRSMSQVLHLGNGKLLSQIPHFPVEPSTKHFLICFTSGTTGKPKGAIHSHRSLMASFYLYDNFTTRADGDRVLIWHPFGHMSGSFSILLSLLKGSTIIVFSSSDIEQILQATERYRVKVLNISANQAMALANNDYQNKYDLSSLFLISHSGMLIATNIIRAIQRKYKLATMNIYGSTEFMACVDGFFCTTTNEYRPGCVGPVKAGVEMKIVDLDSGKSLPPNEQGEICARGMPCFVGYLNHSDATKNTVDQCGWYHSGDIGYFDDEGRLFYTDRIKEMIKYKLYSVIPAEIEDFLHRHAAVEAVCVVGVPHATDGHLVRAYVQLVDGKSVTEQELVHYVEENMGFQKRLRAGVRFIADMPRTVIGKVDRQHFKRLVKDELITEQVP